MLAAFPAQNIQFDQNDLAQTSWWMGEKYDGVRCCWNHVSRRLYSRNGANITLPREISNHMPKTFLDAEIWFGRGNFPDAVKVKSVQESPNVEWSHMRIVAFDNPDPATHEDEFEQRYKSVLLAFDPWHPFLIAATRVLVTKKQHLTASSQHIIQDGGEGVILRKPKSLYEHGRSSNLLKLKATRGDQEALVSDIIETGEQEQLLLHLADGTSFKINTPSSEEMDPLPNIGDIVMFSYENYSKSMIPVEPKIQRIRTDLSWDEVLQNAQRDTNDAAQLNSTSKKKISQHPAGHWTADRHANMRAFFEQFAQERNFDPLVPENWYSLPALEVYKSKGAATIINYFKGGYASALVSIFPDIGLSTSQFSSLPRNYWGDVANRRAALEAFARSQGFDPLIPEHWYNITSNTVKAATETHGDTVLNYYGGSFVKSLIHLFPDIGLDVDQFTFLPTHYWAEKGNQREYLDALAKQCGFDPLKVENWYSFKFSVFFASKRGRTIASYHDGSAIKTIKAVYDELDFDDAKFPSFSANHWKNTSNRRAFFIEYAREHKFDPLVPENWYSRKLSIEKERRVSSIVRYYRGSLTSALIDLFPDVAFQKKKFPVVPLNHWKDMKNVRDYFVQVATEKGFDPLAPENWYRFPFFRSLQRASSILRYFGHNYVRALTEAFPDIRFDLSRFPKKTGKYWEDIDNRKKLFSSIAKRRGFDPSDSFFWSSTPFDVILSYKGARAVLKHYGNDLGLALRDMFPEMECADFPKNS
eukprot:Phypoly_transcript_02489.p1 GENE.Phypoly_transcript_02489~~Phypoly_transcript_02489.p1  ORF type:complete len:757 (+),score=113.72 Phypoly_transcript_02489:481-2751(+)